MLVVRDHLHGETRVGEGDFQQARLAPGPLPHRGGLGAPDVDDVAQARGDDGDDLLLFGVAVPRRGRDAQSDQATGQVDRAGQLGGKGEDADDVRVGQQRVHAAVVGRAQVGRVLRARLGRAEIGPLHMHAQHLRPLPRLRHPRPGERKARGQVIDGRGGGGGQQRGDAMARVLAGDGCEGFGRGLVEGVAHRAVGVNVDEAGRDDSAARVDALHARGQLALGQDGRDGRVIDEQRVARQHLIGQDNAAVGEGGKGGHGEFGGRMGGIDLGSGVGLGIKVRSRIRSGIRAGGGKNPNPNPYSSILLNTSIHWINARGRWNGSFTGKATVWVKGWPRRSSFCVHSP